MAFGIGPHHSAGGTKPGACGAGTVADVNGVGVLCILQARVSSTRLPGKVLEPVLGEPMLARQLERIGRARRIDRLVVATSDQPSDDEIERLCGRIGVACHRGSLPDVLDRFHGAASAIAPRHVMRLTGDCPLTDPSVLDALIELHVDGGFDYSSNVRPRTYPHGLDAEIFTIELLERAWHEAHTPYEREHVTPFMNAAGRDGVRQGSLVASEDRSELRWTVDHPEDLAFVRAVFEALYPRDPAFTTADVLAFLGEHPEVAAINVERAVPRAT